MLSRAILVAALFCPILSGCSDCRCLDAQQEGAFADATPALPGTLDAHCVAIAKYREDEASFQHEDDRTLQQVYAFTYKGCATWRSTHLSTHKQ